MHSNAKMELDVLTWFYAQIQIKNRHTHRNREQNKIVCLFGWFVVYLEHVLDLQVAVKRQQAVEDAIAMRLMSNETGKTIDTLPPGKIFGMSITEPCNTPSSNANATENLTLAQKAKIRKYLWIGVRYAMCDVHAKVAALMCSMQDTMQLINLIATVELLNCLFIRLIN